jgi:hypothetical protein
VPADLHVVAVETRHLDAEDELALFLVQLVVVTAGTEQSGRVTQAL